MIFLAYGAAALLVSVPILLLRKGGGETEQEKKKQRARMKISISKPTADTSFGVRLTSEDGMTRVAELIEHGLLQLAGVHLGDELVKLAAHELLRAVLRLLEKLLRSATMQSESAEDARSHLWLGT